MAYCCRALGLFRPKSVGAEDLEINWIKASQAHASEGQG
jgi:hypothetical protein